VILPSSFGTTAFHEQPPWGGDPSDQSIWDFTLMMLGLPWTGMTIPQKDRPYPQVSDCLLETLQSRSLQGPVTGPGVGVETDFKGELSFLQYRFFSFLPFRGLPYWQTQWLP
jgi:hypothetical protein